jgi:cytochrome c biogenesis protein CcdA
MSILTLLATAPVNFSPIVQPVLDVLNAILWPLIAVVGSAGTVYCVFLGLKIAKSDEQNSREKAKKDLLGAVIGFALIFVLIVALKLAMPILLDWAKSQM